MSHLTRLLTVAAFAFVLSACGGGGGNAPSTAPAATTTSAVIRATALAVTNTTNPTLQAAVGSTVTLDASGSTAIGGIASYAWSVTAKPAASTATFSSATSAIATFAPDALGSYELTLQIVDANGSTASTRIALEVSAVAPTVNVVSAVSFTGPSGGQFTQSVTIGSVVTLDATASADSTGKSVAVSWLLVSAPAGSTANLQATGTVARFSPDLAGAYQVRVRGTDSAGTSSDVVYTFNASSSASNVVVSTSVTTIGGSGNLNAAVGELVSLFGNASTLPPGDAATLSWVLVGKPAGSSLTQLGAPSPGSANFVPDVPGLYTAQFTLLDNTTGVSSFFKMFVTVVQGPTALVSASASPVAMASGPTFVGAVGGPVTLRGGGSYDPSGDALRFSWVMVSAPAGSTASLAPADAATTTFTPDLDGKYTIALTVTNSAGFAAAQSVVIYVGSYPPVARVDHDQVQTLLGGSVSASAAASYDLDGNALGFSWSIDARPTGSTATIASPTSPVLDFTPDVAGTYYATVTVSDGPVSSIAAVTIVALSASSGTVPLAYAPLQSRFSKSLGKALIVAANPNTLHIVDPSAATDVSVALPTAVKSLSISPDGRLAAVLHEGSVSLVDLNTASLLHSSASGGSQTDAFVNNAGLVYLVGQTGGQWVTPGFTVIDGRTGTVVQTANAFAAIYGTTKGILSDVTGKIFTMSEGLSPAQIYATAVDPTSGSLGSTTQSPYWGDYGMLDPFWLSSGDQSLLFTTAGTYFRTSDLSYVGNLGVYVLSMSHSSTASEAVALEKISSYNGYGAVVTYPAVYKRYTGSLLYPANDVSLPVIGNAQTYGLAIFHAADDRHVMVVQTGSNQAQATVQYFLVVR